MASSIRRRFSGNTRYQMAGVVGVGGGQKWWHRSLWFDWLGILVSVAFLAIIEFGTPLTTRFDRCTNNGQLHVCNVTSPEYDETLGYPKVKSDTVPSSMLFVIAVGIPIFMFIVTQLICIRLMRPWNWKFDLHHAMLGFCQCLIVTLVVTEMFKKYAGRYRPDFYAIVQNAIVTPGGDVEDGRKSYPSGHSSVSFCGMTYLTLYLLGKTGAFQKGPGNFLKALGCFSFMLIAGFVSVSRIVDYRHNPSDVNAGAFIGFSSTALFYHLNFNPIWHPLAHLPRLHQDLMKHSALDDDDEKLLLTVENGNLEDV